jgi:RNA polymerase sigma-70 factor (ECF subfamily)
LEAYLHQSAIGAQPAEVKAGEASDVADLTRRMAVGEEQAYRKFYDAYYDRLSRYLLVVSRGDEDAAVEALQAALVRVARHIKIFTDEAVFWSWLTVLARTALSDQNRTKRRYLAFLDRFRWQTRAEPGLAGSSESDEDARLLRLLEANLSELPPEDKQLLEWKYLERRSVRDIAENLQISEKAVDSRLLRVRRRLKQAVLTGLQHE